MWKSYYNASDIEHALKVLDDQYGQAKIVAGGTDLILELERGLWPEVNALIDVSRIRFNKGIYKDKEGYIHINPFMTHNECLASKLLRDEVPLLFQALWQIGSPQIRNRGTIAGNLATSSPANDSITPLMALNAELTLSSHEGSRQIKLSDFYTGVRKNILKPNELITDIRFLGLNNIQRSIFLKYALRNAQAISVVNIAMIIEVSNNTINKASITLGAVAPTIIHAKKTEEYLNGKNIDLNLISELSQSICDESKPIDDIRGSANFRKQMIKVLAKKGLNILFKNEKYDPVPKKPIMLSESHKVKNEISDKSYNNFAKEIVTIINGKEYIFKNGLNKTLLRLIREDAGLIGTKEGCAEGECGSCTLFLDGKAVMSCMVPAPRAHMAKIETIESIASNGKLHPIQEAFIEEGAVQCGYCTPGFIMSGVKLLEEEENPKDTQIKEAFAGNLCRCTGYYKIIKAVEKAAEKNRNE